MVTAKPKRKHRLRPIYLYHSVPHKRKVMATNKTAFADTPHPCMKLIKLGKKSVSKKPHLASMKPMSQTIIQAHIAAQMNA